MKHNHYQQHCLSSSSSTEAVSSSSSSSASDQSHLSVQVVATTACMPAASRDFGWSGQVESVVVERWGEFAAVCKWSISNFLRVKARALWSKCFEVDGYDCRFLVYPKGDSQALPGYISVYLQIMDPRGTSSSKWDCFASYRLSVVNQADESKSIHHDSWHRFSSKKKSHGWCDFTPSASIVDSKLGFLFNSESILITVDIVVLNESVNFTCENNEMQSSSNLNFVVSGPIGDVLSGKFYLKDS